MVAVPAVLREPQQRLPCFAGQPGSKHLFIDNSAYAALYRY